MTSRQGGSLLGPLDIMRRMVPGIGLLVTLSCGNGTSNNDLIPSPSFSWRGRIVDSVTGAPVDHTALSIREQASHQLAGLIPHLDLQRFSNHLFLAEYSLHGFHCAEPSDTSLTLHLEITDSLGRYQPAEHSSTWLLNCDRSPEPAPEPFPTEDSLRVLLQPSP
jgi:hypothetical protein